MDLKGQRQHGHYGTGFSDNLEPLEPLDLGPCKTINDLVTAMKKTSFLARTVGEAADVLETMVRDRECFKVLTLSGAMTAAKMGLVVCDMIDRGMVDAIVSTGALMAHGFIESAGMTHFKYKFGEMNDEELYHKGYDRIYDTLELEKNLDDAELITRKVYDGFKDDDVVCSYRINERLGKYLAENTEGRGILKSAYLKKVPVFVPAFTDSEFGLDFGLHRRVRMKKGKKPLAYDPFIDLQHFADTIMQQKTLGIFTVGGGVPRNWAQQVAPYLDITQSRLGEKDGGRYFKRYKYAVRICPESVNWGGLSGSTYSEAISWGKIVPKTEGGMQSEVLADATVVWPLIVKAVMERLDTK